MRLAESRQGNAWSRNAQASAQEAVGRYRGGYISKELNVEGDDLRANDFSFGREAQGLVGLKSTRVE